MIEEVLDKKSGAILFKKTKETKQIERLTIEVDILKEKIDLLERIVLKLAKESLSN